MSITIQVQTKARKHYPSTQTKYSVELDRNNFIKIYADGELKNFFNMGDEASYGSYNLIYTGIITKITDKMVQITAYPGSTSERRHNLSLYEFCWRNAEFDPVKVAAYNHNEMYYI